MSGAYSALVERHSARREAARHRRARDQQIRREAAWAAHRLHADAMIREVVREVGAGGGANA